MGQFRAWRRKTLRGNFFEVFVDLILVLLMIMAHSEKKKQKQTNKQRKKVTTFSEFSGKRSQKHWPLTQLAFTWSKSAIETREQYLKSTQSS